MAKFDLWKWGLKKLVVMDVFPRSPRNKTWSLRHWNGSHDPKCRISPSGLPSSPLRGTQLTWTNGLIISMFWTVLKPKGDVSLSVPFLVLFLTLIHVHNASQCWQFSWWSYEWQGWCGLLAGWWDRLQILWYAEYLFRNQGKLRDWCGHVRTPQNTSWASTASVPT